MANSAFVVGTGRCGTHFLQKLFDSSKHVNAFHIQDSNFDSFFRYVQWYGLNIDQEPFFRVRKDWIERSEQEGKLYFESNPYVSHHIRELSERFRSKFIFIFRSPEAVIRSHIVKGWYKDGYQNFSESLIPGLDYDVQLNHSLGRIIPKEFEERKRWLDSTQAGKIAWMWSEVNSMILDQLKELPEDQKLILGIEDLDYDKFEEICGFLEVKPHLNASKFSDTQKSKPGKAKRTHSDPWSKKESQEIKLYTQALAKDLGYESDGQ